MGAHPGRSGTVGRLLVVLGVGRWVLVEGVMSCRHRDDGRRAGKSGGQSHGRGSYRIGHFASRWSRFNSASRAAANSFSTKPPNSLTHRSEVLTRLSRAISLILSARSARTLMLSVFTVSLPGPLNHDPLGHFIPRHRVCQPVPPNPSRLPANNGAWLLCEPLVQCALIHRCNSCRADDPRTASRTKPKVSVFGLISKR